ncbi:response regulator [Aliikangiella maris]|uniref:Response regulator n=2 Tax=Aliikangiella maris TaxID=3162458 RepID=A0ABV3MJK6_9GAMM
MNTQNYQTASILLVEDDDVDAKGIERALRKLKIANPLIRARDGIEALELLEDKVVEKPYIILLDLNMPRMNGIEFLEYVRKRSSLSTSVIFVLTTSKSDEDKYLAYKQHIAGYIVKENLDTGFDALTQLLDHYWRIVELPLK